jgi:hypothetical protein
MSQSSSEENNLCDFCHEFIDEEMGSYEECYLCDAVFQACSDCVYELTDSAGEMKDIVCCMECMNDVEDLLCSKTSPLLKDQEKNYRACGTCKQEHLEVDMRPCTTCKEEAYYCSACRVNKPLGKDDGDLIAICLRCATKIVEVKKQYEPW